MEEKKQDGYKSVLVWTDGSVKEYLQKNCIGNIETLSKSLGVSIFWCFFGENHGKNICDPQFARLKSRVRIDINGDMKLEFESAEDVANHLMKSLSRRWNMNGEITGQSFSYVQNLNDDPYPRFDGINQTKKYRCYACIDGKMKRKRLACFCAEFFRGENCIGQSIQVPSVHEMHRDALYSEALQIPAAKKYRKAMHRTLYARLTTDAGRRSQTRVWGHTPEQRVAASTLRR